MDDICNMKDLSFFLFKNYLGSKMRKSFNQFCNGDGSTYTLNQHHHTAAAVPPSVYSPYRQPTLEEMILQLELEEAASRRAKVEEDYGEVPHRMSCVNSSDILRSARSALNQYPRFSLDGRDVMYRSSFRNMSPAAVRRGLEPRKMRGLPAVVAGERVVWCSPGVVAKLMGLEAMPVPVHRHRRREETAKKRSAKMGTRQPERGSCSRQGYCVMKPLTADVELRNEELEWQMLRFRSQNDGHRYKYQV